MGELTVKHAAIWGKNGRSLPASWKTSSYFRSFSAFYRLEDDLAVCFPVHSIKLELFARLPVYFEAVEKVCKERNRRRQEVGESAPHPLKSCGYKIDFSGYNTILKSTASLSGTVPPPLFV
jgi:hypothetical protein